MKRYHHEDVYPLPVDAMYALFTERTFFEERYRLSGDLTEFIHFGPEGDRFRIDVRRHVQLKPGTQVPALARRFVREKYVLHTRLDWDNRPGLATRTGNYRFEVEGVPVHVTGTMRLAPQGNGSSNHVDVTVDCSVPLVGGKIAEMVGERVEATLGRDYQSTLAYLHRRGLIQA